MTFTEAAAQVLRLVGKPLHYKEITDVAIEKNLLSHVGKSPEVTMGARLAALVKKGDKDNPLVRVKPGVFALREWDKGTIDKGLADHTPALERIASLHSNNEPGSAAEAQEPGDEEATEVVAELARASYSELEDEEARPPDQEELARAEIAQGATELFAPEADDDEPIFGAEDEDEESEEAGALDRDGGIPRRRRRRRRGRGSEPRGDDLPSYTVSDAPADVGEPRAEVERPTTAERPRENDRERPERERFDRERPERERPPDRERPLDRDRAERERFDRERSDRERPEGRDRPDRERAGERGAPLEELAGRELADTVAHLLASFDRNRGPVALQVLAEAAQRRGRPSGELSASQGLISAAARADNLRKNALGQRPRFRITANRIGLTDWLLDGEMTRLERELIGSAERYREAARRSLLRKLQELPHRAVGEVVLLLLERLGITDLQSVRRTGAHGTELHLTGRANGAAGEMRVAVVVRRDGREIGRERVTELRGALHHYGPANAGWLVTTGQVLSGAREEASAAGAAPVTLLDGSALARLCEEHGIGVLQTRITLALPDMDLFESLRQL